MRKITETRLAWGLLAFLAVADAAGLALTGIEIKLGPCLVTGGVAAFLLLIAYVYSKLRPEPRLVGLALTGAQLIIYTALAGILSYILTTAGRPLIDHWLLSVDHFLGLDWKAMYARSEPYVFLRLLFLAAYYSVIPQFLIVLIVLFTKKRFFWGRELFWLFIVTSLVSVIVAGIFPAAGAFVTFNVQLDDPYVQHFLALREGSLKIIDLRDLQGVVQFPSFHLAMAIIMAYATRGIPVLFPLLLMWNALTIVATPLVGGHYFADLGGGLLVTLVGFVAVRSFRAHLQKTEASYLSQS
jgi:hypothetical protein